MENRVMSLQILQRHRAVSLPQHGFIEYISDHSNAETARNALSASWYLKSIVTGASISLVTIARASPEMDHWPALRAATKGPPAGSRRLKRKTTTDMVTLNRWNRSTVRQSRPSHGVTSSTGSITLIGVNSRRQRTTPHHGACYWWRWKLTNSQLSLLLQWEPNITLTKNNVYNK